MNAFYGDLYPLMYVLSLFNLFLMLMTSFWVNMILLVIGMSRSVLFCL